MKTGTNQETQMITAAQLRQLHNEDLPQTLSAPSAPTPRPATPLQMEYIGRLITERGANRSDHIRENMSTRDASREIDRLLKMPKVARPTQVAPMQDPEAKGLLKVHTPLKEGIYTVVFPEGDHRTYRVKAQPEGARFKPGSLIVSFLAGRNNDRDYQGFGDVLQEGGEQTYVTIWAKYRTSSNSGVKRIIEGLKVLLGDPKAAAESYARESGNCYVCGRTLSDPESISLGIGPICLSKGY